MAEAAGTQMQKSSGWVTVWGLLMIVAGIVAIVVPAPAALAFALLLAWLFVFVGVVQLVHAFQQRAEDGFIWKLISGLAPLALGILMLVNPIASITTLALVIAAFLFASGVSSLMLAMKVKPKSGWGWVAFDGALSIVIAVLIAMGWPQNSIGFIGILVGIMMISGGMWRIVLARALRTPGPR
ncbi:MAG: DUF308 domain-containing protein [Burkholderiales bacterium]|nr:DUF308 domain-containing protein [Burkholderiales bacterium]